MYVKKSIYLIFIFLLKIIFINNPSEDNNY